MKKFVLHSLLALSLTGWAQADSLTVAWDLWEPWQMPEGQGVDLEIISLVLGDAGFKTEYRQLPWDKQLKQLESGEIDIVLDASRTADRAQFAVWTDPYRKERAALMAPEDSDFFVKSLKQLAGEKVKIGVIQEAWYGEEFGELAKTKAFRSLLQWAPDGNTNLQALLDKKINLLIDDPVSILYKVKKNNQERLQVILTVRTEDVHFMVSKKTLKKYPDLIERLNKSLAGLKSSGMLQAVLDRYGVK